jgi:RTX calcium-binding nonapeptide repeat (4 copies)
VATTSFSRGSTTTTYASRTEPIGVDFTVPGLFPQQNGSSNDGPEGARDHIETVETVVGGSGADVMKAGTDAITFRGGDGADTLTGSPGTETLFGGNGADTIDPLAGADTVLAGAGVTAPSRVLFDLAYTFAAGRRATKLRNVTVDVEPGAHLSATCRTKKNERCTRTRDLARAAAPVRLRGFEGKSLPVGAKHGQSDQGRHDRRSQDADDSEAQAAFAEDALHTSRRGKPVGLLSATLDCTTSVERRPAGGA